jgi:3-hydroxyisobutyrate dehydrogenase-like beta-hydroxyacid dehydrogenase
MTEPVTHVAFCGLGRMGQAMATRVAGAGFSLTVWNRSRGAAEAVVSATGADAAETPADASRSADVVMTMLTDGPAVLQVLAGPGGVLAGIKPGAAVVDGCRVCAAGGEAL